MKKRAHQSSPEGQSRRAFTPYASGPFGLIATLLAWLMTGGGLLHALTHPSLSASESPPSLRANDPQTGTSQPAPDGPAQPTNSATDALGGGTATPPQSLQPSTEPATPTPTEPRHAPAESLTGAASSSALQKAVQKPGPTAELKPRKVLMILPLDHAALREIERGFRQKLAQTYPGPVEIETQVAQNDANLQRALLQQGVQQKVDLVATVGQVSTQMALSVVKTQPILSLAAWIEEDKRRALKPCNVTGVYDEVPAPQQLQFLHQTFPQIRHLSLLYSPSEKVLPEVEALQKTAQQLGLSLQRLQVNQLGELHGLTKALDKKSQAIFILKDHLVVSGIGAIVQAAKKRKIPVISADEGSVKAGATWALGVREAQIGEHGAELAAQILTGTPLETLPFQRMEAKDLCVFLRPKAFEQISLSITELEKGAQVGGYSVVKME